MRLSILDTAHGLGTKAMFAMIRAFSGQPVLDVVKLVKYRPGLLWRADASGHAGGHARSPPPGRWATVN